MHVSKNCRNYVLASSCLSVCMKQLCFHWMDFCDSYIGGFHYKSVEFSFGQNLTELIDTLHEDPNAFSKIISPPLLMRKHWGCHESQNMTPQSHNLNLWHNMLVIFALHTRFSQTRPSQ
jgi:hypothetical protein